MNTQELAKLLMYADANSILIVNKHNKIQKVRTPFKVVVIKKTGKFRLYSIQYVHKVKVTQTLTTVYQIGSKWYYYWYFDILV